MRQYREGETEAFDPWFPSMLDPFACMFTKLIENQTTVKEFSQQMHDTVELGNRMGYGK